MQSRIIKTIIFISFFMGSVFFLKQPVFASHGSYSPSIPDSIEDKYLSNCPTTTGASGYTIHGVYPTAAIVSSATRSTNITLNAASYLCELASYSSVTNIQITVTSIEATNTTAKMSLPSYPYTFNVGSIYAKKTFAGPVSATATVTDLTATSTNKGNNCFNVYFYAKATYGTSTQTSGTGIWPVCVTWYPKVKVTSFTLNPYTWERNTLQYTIDNYQYFTNDYAVRLQAYLNGAWDFNLATNLGNPTTANPAFFTILENIGPGQMRVWVDVPDGFRIRGIYINGVRQSGADCAGAGYCILPFNIFNYSTDFVDIQFDYVKIDSKYQICPTAATTPRFAKEDFYFAVGANIDISKQKEWIYGYIFDAFAKSAGDRIKINIGRDGNTNQFSYYPPNVIYAPDSQLIEGKGRAWALRIPDDKKLDKWEARGYWDMEGSAATSYLTMSGNPVIWGPGFANDCNINFYENAIPWLQTTNGNVVSSNGTIQGSANTASSSQSQAVVSTINGINKADYLVMAKVANTFQFCSTYDYILTNTNADSSTPTCDSGDLSGGGYTSLNSYDLNINVGGTLKDSVVAAATSVFDAIGASNNCRFENMSVDDLVISLQSQNPGSSCPYGTVYLYKITPGSTLDLPNIVGVNRKATILVKGSSSGKVNVKINGEIKYSSSLYGYRNLQSLAIVADGDIRIDGVVKNIQAALYSAGKINTCYETAAAAAALACNNQLVVSGMLVGKNGFQLQRTLSFTDIKQYYDPVTNLNNPLKDRVGTPSEKVNFDPKIVINPPPGLDILNFYKATGYKYLLDKAEYAPRF